MTAHETCHQNHHSNFHHHHRRHQFGHAQDEQSHHTYHVSYWRTDSGHIIDDVELKEDDNLQADEIYHVHHKQDHRRLIFAMFASFFLAVTMVLRSGYFGSHNDHPPSFAVRLSAGATQPYTDSRGYEWIPDNGAHGSNDGSFDICGESTTHKYLSNVTIENAGSVGEEIFRSERYFNAGGGASNTMAGYEIPVPFDGLYAVTLHFAELWFDSEEQRVMDVYVEDNLLRRDYDILQVAGGSFVATRIESEALVSDGAVSIGFESKDENAKINGIEVTHIDNFETE